MALRLPLQIIGTLGTSPVAAPSSAKTLHLQNGPRKEVIGRIFSMDEKRAVHPGRRISARHKPAAIVATGARHQRYPIAATGLLFQLKSGLRSAPRLPHALQMNLCSISDSRISSGQRSSLIAIEWL